MPADQMRLDRKQLKARVTLVALILVCTVPVLASYFAFFVWQPRGTVNYGELIVPSPLPDVVLTAVGETLPVALREAGSEDAVNVSSTASKPPVGEDGMFAAVGGTLDRGAVTGHWTLVYVGTSACDDACRAALYATRQTRLAQGKQMERVSRLWLVADDGQPAAELLQQHPGLLVARADSTWLTHFPGNEQGRHVYLVDPLGNVMMRFPEQPEIKLVIKDVQRLLKYSGWGERRQGMAGFGRTESALKEVGGVS